MSDSAKRWPWLAIYGFYPLTKAVAAMLDFGWFLRAHVLVLGPIFIAVGWREKAPTPGGKERGATHE